MSAPLEFGLRVVAAYLLGSIVGSLVIGRFRGVDIRRLGSGNAGGTNALRTQGLGFALGVIVIDVFKGYAAARWLPTLGSPQFASPLQDWLAPTCGFAAIAGHVFPIFYGLRGGKGAATLVGALAALAPWLLAVLLATWLVMVLLVGYVGLASMTAAAILPVALYRGESTPDESLLVFTIAVAGLVLFTHRSNVARMLARTEPRARRLWLLGRVLR